MRTLVAILIALLALPPVAVAYQPAGILLPDDAGSGRNAPGTIESDVEIRAGVLYHAAFQAPIDLADYYRFEARAGDVLDFVVRGPVELHAILDSDGVELDSTPSLGVIEFYDVRVVAPEDGVYFASVEGFATAAPYCFALGVNEDPLIENLLDSQLDCAQAGAFATDDAGTGTDAPELRSGRIVIEPGVLYRGAIQAPTPDPEGTLGLVRVDPWDLYTLHLQQGQHVLAWVRAPGLLASIEDDAGSAVATLDVVTLAGTVFWVFDFTAAADGSYHVRLEGTPQAYCLGYGVDGGPTGWPGPEAAIDCALRA